MKIKRGADNLRALLLVIFLFYPVAVYFGLKVTSVKTLGWILVSILALRMVVTNVRDPLGFAVLLGAGTGIGLSVAASMFDLPILIKLYPAAMSAAFFTVFMTSLFSGETVISRIASRFRGPLNSEALSYTHKVTIVWCLFFAMNGFIGAYTAYFTSDETWTLYNGLISYLLMGLLFTGEYAVRRAVLKKAAA